MVLGLRQLGVLARTHELGRATGELAQTPPLAVGPGRQRIVDRCGGCAIAGIEIAQRIHDLGLVGAIDGGRIVLARGVGCDALGPLGQHARRHGRAGEHAAQQSDRRPVPHPPLLRAHAGLTGDRLAAVGQHVLEQLPEGGAERVGLLGRLALGKGCRRPEPALDILATTLDEMGLEAAPQLLVVGDSAERRVEQPEQRAEALLDAAVRRGGDQDQVPGAVGGELGQQLVSLLLRTAVRARRPGGAVRLVDDDQIGRVAQELVALAVRLDEVDAGDEAARPAIDREIPPGQLAFQPRHGRGLHDVGFERELVGQLGLPLVAQMRRAQARRAAGRCRGRAARARSAPPRSSCRRRHRRRSAGAPGRAAAPTAAGRTGRAVAPPRSARASGTARHPTGGRGVRRRRASAARRCRRAGRGRARGTRPNGSALGRPERRRRPPRRRLRRAVEGAEAPTGRPGRTTQSRPRAETSCPGRKVRACAPMMHRPPDQFLVEYEWSVAAILTGANQPSEQTADPRGRGGDRGTSPAPPPAAP